MGVLVKTNNMCIKVHLSIAYFKERSDNKNDSVSNICNKLLGSFKVEPVGCPETSLSNYQSTLRNMLVEIRYQTRQSERFEW